MAHLALFIGIGDRPSFQGGHGRKGLVKAGFEGVEVGRINRHPADIKPDALGWIVPKQCTEPLPQPFGIRTGGSWKGHRGHWGLRSKPPRNY